MHELGLRVFGIALVGSISVIGCGLVQVYESGPTAAGGAAGTAAAGGSGATSSHSGGNGAGGQGGSTGGCDPSATWIVAVPAEASAMTMAPDGRALVVGYGTTIANRDYLVALDPCTGTTLATASVAATVDSNYYPKAVVWLGGKLLVVGNGDYGVSTDKSVVLLHDPQTFQPNADPVAIPVSGGAYGASNGIWQVAVGPDAALWMSVDADAGGLRRYAVGSAPLSCDLSSDAGAGRGLAATPTGLVLCWNKAAPATDPLQLAFIDLSSVTPGQCPTAPPTLVALSPDGADGRVLATSGTYTVAASIVYTNGGSNLQAGLARYAGQTVDALFSYPEPADAHPLIDGFAGLAVDPPNAADPRVFVGGSTDAQFVNGTLTGAAFVGSLPLLFNNAPGFSPVMATTVKLVTVVAAAPDAVYVGGLGPGGQGYVARCTRDLQCPAGF